MQDCDTSNVIPVDFTPMGRLLRWARAQHDAQKAGAR